MRPQDKHLQMLHLLSQTIQRDIPSYRLIVKEKHWLYRLIFKVMPRFHETITTTIFPNVYMPENIYIEPACWKILAHEYVHLMQARKHPFIFLLKYVFPQTLGLLALMGFGLGPHALWALLFLTPLPAYFRMKYELEGYAMSMAVNFWRYQSVSNEQKQFVKNVFLGGTYYFMWPFRKWIDRKINTIALQIERGEYDERPVFTTVRMLIEYNWRTP